MIALVKEQYRIMLPLKTLHGGKASCPCDALDEEENCVLVVTDRNVKVAVVGPYVGFGGAKPRISIGDITPIASPLVSHNSFSEVVVPISSGLRG